MTKPLSTLLKPLEIDTHILKSIKTKLGTIDIDADAAYEIVRQELQNFLHLPNAFFPNQYLLFKFEANYDGVVECKKRIYDVLIQMAKEKPLMSDSCSICLAEIELEKDAEKLTYVASGHVYDKECLDTWILEQRRKLVAPTNPTTNVPLHQLEIESAERTQQGYKASTIVLAGLYTIAAGSCAGLVMFIFGAAGSLLSSVAVGKFLVNSRGITHSMFRLSEDNVSTSRAVRATLLLSFSCVYLAMFLSGASNTIATGLNKSGIITDEVIPISVTASNIAATVALGAALLFATFVRDCLQYRDNRRVQSERQPLIAGRIN